MKLRQRLIEAICNQVKSAGVDPEVYLDIRRRLDECSLPTLSRIAGGDAASMIDQFEEVAE
jgi:hypothetical protein